MDRWQRFDGKPLHCPLSEELLIHLKKDPHISNGQKRIYVGTDSQIYGHRVAFVTVVIIRLAHTTRIYYHKEHICRIMSLAERLFTEVHRSLKAARLIQPVAGQYGVPIEIHVDVNSHQQFPSHQHLKGLVGYVSSMGYCYRIKPDAFASTSCADRLL